MVWSLSKSRSALFGDLNPFYALASTSSASIIGGMGDRSECSTHPWVRLRFSFASAASLRSDRFGFEANDTKQFVSFCRFSPLHTEYRRI